MNNNTLLLKIRQRLNKISSNDSANIEAWQILEAHYKAQLNWSRRDETGNNLLKQGDEQSTTRIDDLQILLKDSPILTTTVFDTYEETTLPLPTDYMRWKRFKAVASNSQCQFTRPLKVYLGIEADVDLYLQDKDRQPSFGYGETFAVFKGGKIQIYTNGKFTIDSLQLVYYRYPVRVQIPGVMDPYTGTIPTVNVECEFKEDVQEILVDETAKILAGDIENQFQYQRNDKSVQEDT